MQIVHDILTMRRVVSELKIQRKSTGFVATMGALHNGHLALIDASKAKDDVTICSIFINPTQFNNPSGLKDYPRETENDIQLLEKAGCDIVFIPSESEMYQNKYVLNFDFGYLEEIMEGQFRPGHFKGVGLVVSKLFNIVEPDRAYFGRKDLQQLILIQTMTRELLFDVEIIPVATVREGNGVAMSSRNKLLSEKELETAADLYNSMKSAQAKLIGGISVGQAADETRSFFQDQSPIELEYFEIVDIDTLERIDKIVDESKVVLCIAGYLGKVRLIDNMSLI